MSAIDCICSSRSPNIMKHTRACQLKNRQLDRPEGVHPKKRKRPPMQPLVIAKDGLVRFQANRLVAYLLDNGGIDMNKLAEFSILTKVPRSDRAQFAQLIGYSLRGFGELSYVSDELYERAEARAPKEPAPKQKKS